MNRTTKKCILLLGTFLGILMGCSSQKNQSYCAASQRIAPVPPVSEIPTEESVDTAFDFTLCFAGDVNLDENWGTTQYLSAQPNGIYDCISEELVRFMQDADFMCLNNEFSYSLRGKPLNGKAYTFRADPDRVEVLRQLGVDAVTLANNHVYDYGRDAMLDTFSVLEDAGIPYFGAGDTQGYGTIVYRSR